MVSRLRAGGTGAGASGRQARIGRRESVQNFRPWVLARIGLRLGRELLEDPGGSEQGPAVGAPADAHVVARARVQRQVALDRIPLVVLVDELEEVGRKRPSACERPPALGERAAVA